MRVSVSSAGSTEPSVPSKARSAAVRPFSAAPPCGTTLRPPHGQPSAVAAAPPSPSAAHCTYCSRPRRGADRARCTAGRRGCAARHRSASRAPSRRAQRASRATRAARVRGKRRDERRTEPAASPCHLRSLATYALTQLLRHWSRKSVGPRRCIQWSVGPRRWLVDLAASLLPGGAAIGEALTSAMEDEHLDFADRGHGRLARLVGQQAVSLEHGCARSREAPGALGGALGLAPRCAALPGGAPGPWHAGAMPGLCRGAEALAR
eukprot:scaffold38934_cov55-Phaeocystis_antarctica.AAC.1